MDPARFSGRARGYPLLATALLLIASALAAPVRTPQRRMEYVPAPLPHAR